MAEKIRSFADLVAWKEAHKLAVIVYKTTDKFPQKETYTLTNQVRRSAISISSNIAEGFSRQGQKEKLQFYYTAKRSLTELQNQLLLSKDVGYISKETFSQLAEQSIKVSKLLNGLIKSIKKKF